MNWIYWLTTVFVAYNGHKDLPGGGQKEEYTTDVEKVRTGLMRVRALPVALALVASAFTISWLLTVGRQSAGLLGILAVITILLGSFFFAPPDETEASKVDTKGFPLWMLFGVPLAPLSIGNCILCHSILQGLPGLLTVLAPLAQVLALLRVAIDMPLLACKAIALLCESAPIMAIVSLAFYPKFCPACLTAVWALQASSFYLNLLGNRRSSFRRGPFSIQSGALFFSIAVLTGVFGRNALEASGIINLTEKVEVHTSMEGQSAEQLITSRSGIDDGSYVLTQPACHACETALTELRRAKIDAISLIPCSVFKTYQCWRPTRGFSSTPTFLIITDGMLRSVTVGIPGDVITRAALFNKLRDAIKSHIGK